MKILLIEDEPGIASFLQQGLTEEGYAIDIAERGNIGLELALSKKYDLFLIDWMLPGLLGIEICQRIRQAKIHTPIIFLTAKDTVHDTIEGLQAGANDYIKKPFHFEELLMRIKVQLRPKTEKNEKLTLGNIVLDTAAYQVWKEETLVSLTQKEFALLEFLMRHKGKVCRRTQIIEEVWDIHFDYDTGIIDVYINALRKKLQLKTEEDYIQTVRGVGYIARD